MSIARQNYFVTGLEGSKHHRMNSHCCSVHQKIRFVRTESFRGKLVCIINNRYRITPLVADVHFNAKVAEAAAAVVEKVRINPGNFVDTARNFTQLEFTVEEYAQELEKIKAKLLPLLHICKDNGTALRIGVNSKALALKVPSSSVPGIICHSCKSLHALVAIASACSLLLVVGELSFFDL